MTRKDIVTNQSPLSVSIDTSVEIWATNSTLEPKPVILEVKAFDLLADGVAYEMEKREVELAPNASTELWKGSLEAFGQPVRTSKSEVPKTLVLSARALDKEGAVLARYSNWCVSVRIVGYHELADL